VAASYRKIDPRIWDDEVFDTLSEREAFAALWLITSRATNRAGVAFFSLGDAAEKLRLDGIDRVSHTLSEVSRKLRWPMELISRNKVVMILRTHFRYNPPTNKKHLTGQLSDLADIPRCNLIEEQYAQTVRPHLEARWQEHFDAVLETLSKGYRKGMPYSRAHVSASEATSEATAEDPLPHFVGDTLSLESKKLSPRALGTNPRALAEEAEAEEETRRNELIAECERRVDTKLADGTLVEGGGVYDPQTGTLTWNKVSTQRLEQIVKELLETGGERKEVTPME